MKNLIAATVLAIATFVAGPAVAQIPGPAIGSSVPALEAVRSDGKAVALADIVGAKGTVLVFFRSAKWCPYCQAQLIALKDAVEPLALRGYTLAAISYDPPDVLTSFAKRQGISYALLSDTNSRMIDAFKLRDPQYKPDSFAYGVPQPSIFVISPNGIVQSKLAEEGYKNRPPVATVIAEVDRVLAR
jgi:peroxiredoxin